MSKIEAGRTTLNLTTFDLPALLNDLEMMFRVRTEGKKLSFVVELIGDVPRYIMTDINKLRQVFINVLGNAVKFTERGGIGLRVRADRRGTTATSPPRRSRGHRPGHLGGRANEAVPAFRANQDGTKGGDRHGARPGDQPGVCSTDGRRHHGEQPGRQRQHLRDPPPLERERVQAVQLIDKPRPVLSLKPGQEKCRVLIADDVEDNRELLVQILGPVGFEVRLACDGEQAVKEFERLAAPSHPHGFPHAGDGRP